MSCETAGNAVKKLCRLILFFWPLLLCGEVVEVIGTSDLHGDLEHFALLAPVIRRHPQAIKVDAGDLVQGNFVCDTLGGVPMIDALNALHCDLWVPGNHDFELGVIQLRALRKRFKGTMAGAQWRFHNEDVPAWCIFERNGIRCAFIALTEPGVARRAGLLKEFIWRAPERPALKKALAEIRRAGVDAVVLVFHASLHGSGGSLGKLLFDHPGIDAVLCAHSHQEIPGTSAAGAVIAQPGHRAAAAVLFRLVFDGKELHHVESFLLRPEKVPDPELAAIRKQAEKETRSAAGEVLGTIENEAHFGHEAAEAIRRAVKCDVALTAFGTLRPGVLTGRRFHALMPYCNRIIVIECEGRELRRAIASFPSSKRIYAAGKMTSGKCRAALSEYLWFSLSPPGARVVEITPLTERVIIRENLKRSLSAQSGG